MQLFNDCVSRLNSQVWTELSQFDQQVTVGVLAIIGGWKPQLKSGAPVKIKSNDGSFVTGTVVDEGLGRTKVGVIFND